MPRKDGVVLTETATSSAIGRFHAVQDNGSGKVEETSDNGDRVYGVAQDSCDADEDVDVKISGVTKVEVDGSGTAINVGDALMPDSSTSGRLVAHEGNASDRFVARALGSSSAAGDRIEVLLFANQSNTT